MRDKWTVKEVVERHTNTVHRLYWYSGKQCKRIVLDSPMARQLAGYVLIEKDLRSAGLWIEEIDRIRGDDAKDDHQGNRSSSERSRYNLVKGLFVAALTFYGKAFAQCEGRKIKMDKRQLDPSFHEAHDDAIEYRNNFAAHSGAKLIEHAKVALALPPKGAKGVLPRIYREMSQPDYVMNAPGEKSFSELIEHARAVPLRKISELSDKIMNEEVLPKGYTHWDTQ